MPANDKNIKIVISGDSSHLTKAVDNATQSLTGINAALGKVAKAAQATQTKYSALNQTMQNLNPQAAQQAAAAMNNLAAAAGNVAKAAAPATQALTGMYTQSAAASAALKALGNQTNATAASATASGKAAGQAAAQKTKLGNSAKTVNASVKTFSGGLKTLIGLLTSATKGVVSLGKAMLTLPAQGIIRSFGALGSGVGRVNSFIDEHNRTLAKSATYYRGLVGQVSDMNRLINVFGSSIRQIGQGLQNFATVFSLYVSIPVAGFLMNMTKGVIEFQDKIIEARKTTGLFGKDLEDLQDFVIEVSLTSPTSVNDLAGMAGAWGRMGISDPSALAQLTREADKLSIATTLSPLEAIEEVGQLMSLYYENVEDLVKDYPRVASAINELGQQSPLKGEQEILAAAIRIAPVAVPLQISMPDLLGLATTAAERSASPERAGTQVARALTETTVKQEAFAKALNISREELVALIDTDASKFFLMVADALTKIESNAQRVAITEELFGGVGSKAVNSLAAAFGGTIENVELANRAFDEGTSIQVEYERALDSVKNQIGILLNNFRNLGYTIAGTLLPYITAFAAVLIPALQQATEAFEQLSERNKLLIVGFGILMAVLGPILLFIGSLMFSIGIITTGFTALFTQVIGMGVGLAKFAFSIIALLAPLNILNLAILTFIGTLIYLYRTTSQAAGSFAGMFSDFVVWGYNLMTSFASGILDGAGIVRDAFLSVIDGFIGLIQAFSPPKEGPLKGIRDWGRGLMDAYIEGISEANIGPIKDTVMAMAGQITSTSDILRQPYDYNPRGFTTMQGYVDRINNRPVPVSTYRANRRPAEDMEELGDASEQAAPAINQVADAVENVNVALKDGQRIVDEYIITIGAKFSDAFANGLRGLNATATELFGDIFASVRSAIMAFANNSGLEDIEVDQLVLQGADAVLAMMEAFQSGRSVTGILDSISHLVGGLTSDIEGLYNAQIAYNQAQEELDQIRERNKNIDSDLQKEIALISRRNDLTMDERAALIRAARQRASAVKDGADEEEQAAQDRLENLRREVSERRQILETLVGLTFGAKKEPIPKEKADKYDPLAGGPLSNFGYGDIEQKRTQFIDQMNEKVRSAEEQMTGFLSKLERGRELWRGFYAGIVGDTEGLDKEWGKEFWDGWNSGSNIRRQVSSFIDKVKEIVKPLESTYSVLQRIKDLLAGGAFVGFLGGNTQNFDEYSTLEQIVLKIGYAFGFLAARVNEFLTEIEPFLLNIQAIFEEFGFKGLFQGGEDAPVGDIVKQFIEILNVIFKNIAGADGGFIKNVAVIIGDILVTIFSEIDWANIATIIINLVNGVFDLISPENLDRAKLLAGVNTLVSEFFRILNTIDFATFITDITSFVVGIINELPKVDFAKFGEQIGNIIRNFVIELAKVDFVGIGTSLADFVNGLVKGITDLFGSNEDVLVYLTNLASSLVEGILTAVLNIDWLKFADLFVGIGYAILEGLQFGILRALGLGSSVDEYHEFVGNLSDQSYLNEQAAQNAEEPNASDSFFGWLGRESRQLAESSDFWAFIFGVDRNVAEQEVTAVGSDVANYVSSGYVSGITSETNIEQAKVATTNFTDKLVTTTAPDFANVGSSSAETVASSYSDSFKLDVITTKYDQMIVSLNTWHSQNKDALEDVGGLIGGTVAQGMAKALESAEFDAQRIADSFAAWIELPETANILKHAGFQFGLQIVRGIVEAIMRAGAVMSAAVVEAQRAFEANEPPSFAKISSYMPANPYTGLIVSTSGGPEIETSSMPSVDIVIQGNVIGNRAFIDQVVNAVIDRLRKEGRFK